MRWEPGRAWSYMEKFGTVVGCNFVPSYCYNYIQLWYDFREPIIARELDWAKECGVNSLRMFLPLFSFQRGGGWESVKKKRGPVLRDGGRSGLFHHADVPAQLFPP